MILKNLYVQDVVIFRLTIVQSTETILLSLNANFAVRLPNGFVGGTPIFVSHAIKSSAMEIMFQNTQKINSQNVKDLESVQLVEIMVKMVIKKC